MTDVLEKKASDLLLQLDKRLSNVEKILALNDFQQKIIINNINKLLEIVSKNNTDKKSKQQIVKIKENNEAKEKIKEEPKEESFEDKKKRLLKFKPSETNVLGYVPAEQDEDVFTFKVNRRDTGDSNNTELQTGKQIAVTQQIISSSNIPMKNASILIKDSNDKTVKKLSSNENGRWQTTLPKGRYTLYVNGRFATKRVDFSQVFEVIDSSLPIELQIPEAYKAID